MDYTAFWENLARRNNWSEYILPRRSPERFDEEGRMQAQELPSASVVLEHGCGVGRVLRHVRAERRIGVDVSPTFLAEAAKHGIEPVLSNGIDIPLPDDVAQFTFSLMVFQHCEKSDHPKQLEELVRVTDGHVLVQFPKEGYYHQIGGTHTYTREELESLASPYRHTVDSSELVRYWDGVHQDREWFLNIDTQEGST